jgi:hypothetical protein
MAATIMRLWWKQRGSGCFHVPRLWCEYVLRMSSASCSLESSEGLGPVATREAIGSVVAVPLLGKRSSQCVENISLHSVYDTTKCTRDGDMLTAM